MKTAEPHGFSRVMWLVVAMTMATLPFVGQLPPWLTLSIIVLATWRLVIEHRGLVIVPIWSVRLLLVFLVGIVLFLTDNIGFGLSAATPLFVGLLWSKLLELKARRDFLVAGMLCYFLVAVLLFDRQSLFTCLYAIATLTAITIAVVSYHLNSNAQRSFSLGLRLLVQGLPLAAALFVLFPRLQVNFPNFGGQATSGFSDRLTPGDVARMALSDQIVMRVEFPNGDRPTEDQLYWRGLVLSETNGSTWNVGRETPFYTSVPKIKNARLPTIVQDITLQPINQRWLFALDIAEQVPGPLRLALNRSVVRKQAPTQILTYRVTSRIGELPNDRDLYGSALPRVIDPRVRQLALEWRDGGGHERDIAERGRAWFKDQGFTYSLSPGTMDGDAAAEFLFGKRSGFCAHFATAYALVLRVAGIPARVVVGFRGGEYNSYGDFLLVRMNHAHAWCEVFYDGGWHRVDPTAGIPLAPGETQPAAQRIASGNVLTNSDHGPSWMPAWIRGPYTSINQWLAVVDAKWETNVIGLDGPRQDEWLEHYGLKSIGKWILLGLSALALGLMVLSFMWWSRWRPNRQQVDPLVEVYARFCERLAGLGVVRLPSEGPRDFTARAAQTLPTMAEPIRAVGATYEQLRYGPTSAQPAAITKLRGLIRALPRHAPTVSQASQASEGPSARERVS
jgi:protein-glutamine gamma-glutamyltransferase